MGHDDIEGSRDTLLHVWRIVLCCIGWSWMMQKIYYLTSRIDIKIGPSYQDGEEQGKIEGDV